MDNYESGLLIKENDISYIENGISLNELLQIEVKDEQFSRLMSIYKRASNQVLQVLNGVQIEYDSVFNHNIINHTTSRIKAPASILNKMKKKNLELNYRNLIENINDIAGVRAICTTKDDVYTLAKIIEKIPNWNLINEKDYISNPKKSGYSGYHIIVEVPVRIQEENGKKQLGDGRVGSKELKQSKFYLKNQIFVKVEIQLRTMAMDFWATHEHKMKYKTNKKLSFFDSKKLAIYARVLNILDDNFMKISRKLNT
ncbi:MAG: hypothetical protein IKD77_04830 [Bacilli bacterium]|nr:hypothetical protein [Bacilli bacterium]